ncbi:hypothetical protein C8Q73DRAFT_503776 [Cubamyces lactineus]|nr:hypothetical protein C8Q73DRAFT_503776 [Cubamyces lactineus]
MSRRDGLRARFSGAFFFMLYLLTSNIRKAAALDQPVADSCSDPSYSWAYNAQGQSPCQVASDVIQLCGNSRGDNQCYCNPVTYSLWAACSLCNGQNPHSFSDYSNDAQCLQEYTHPPLEGANIPSWANIQLINDDTFDVAAAKQEAEGTQSTNSASTNGHTSLPSTRGTSSEINSTPDGSPTNPGGSPAPSPSQSNSPPKSSSPSSPTGAAGQQTGPAATSDEAQTSDSPTSSRPSGPQPTLTTSGQPSFQPTTTLHTTGSLQSSQSEARPSPTAGSMHAAGSSSSHLGAIIAGAVGGVALIAIASTCIALNVVRRRRRRNQKQTLGTNALLGWWKLSRGQPLDDGPVVEEDTMEEPKVELRSSVELPQEEDTPAQALYTMKLYDPDDPSTYPPRLSEICGQLPMRAPVNVSGAPEIYEVR